MHIKFALPILMLLLSGSGPTAFAQGTEFTYQGRLNDGPSPAHGSFDLAFSLFENSSGPPQVGTTAFFPAVEVVNGLFTVNLDFGNAAFPGAVRFLEIAARSNNVGPFIGLSPRQKLTAVPYAIRAANFSGAVSDVQLSGNIPRLDGNATFTGAVMFNNAAAFMGEALFSAPVQMTNAFNRIVAGSPAGYSPVVSLPVGDGPGCVAVADINQDGLMDLISANAGSGTLSVLTNGKGGFVRVLPDLAVGSGPRFVAARDLNLDGRPDLVSANVNSDTLSVLTNNGAGGFIRVLPDLAAGDGPSSVAVGDLNGDGRLDLISANRFADTLSVLTNNGSGGYVRVLPDLAAGDGPVFVEVGLINADASLDLICANSGANTLSLLTNNGAGGFVRVLPDLVVGDGPRAVAVQDVNGDGKADLVTPNFGLGSVGTTLTVLTNDRPAGFGRIDLTVGRGPHSVAIGDVNADGRPDVICANELDDSLSVLTNDGVGGFMRVLPDLAVGDDPFFVAAADVNADGRLDLVSANIGSDDLSLLIYSEGGFFGIFTGNGSGVTNLNASEITRGTLPDVRLAGAYSGALTFNNPANSYSGNGAGLTLLNANNVTAGTLNDLRLSANVALLASAQTFTASKSFGGGVQLLADSGSAGAPGYGFNGDPNTGLFRPGADVLALSTAGSERLRVAADGNIGIGTLSPNSRLHVNGDGVDPSLRVQVSGTSKLIVQTNGGVAIGANSIAPDNGLYVAGSVGIGINSPAANLHVNGSTRVEGATTLAANTTIGGLFAMARTVVVPTAISPLNPTTSYLVLNPAGAITLPNPAIANGSTLGTVLILVGNSNTDTVTINDGANVNLGAATRVLGNDDTLMLLWNGGVWVEISFVNN